MTDVAIVTGAAQCLGAAIADALEAAGAQVARTDVAGAELELDVTAGASVERAVLEVAERLGERRSSSTTPGSTGSDRRSRSRRSAGSR